MILNYSCQILVDKSLVIRLANTAAEKAKKMVDKIKKSLAQVHILPYHQSLRHFCIYF